MRARRRFVAVATAASALGGILVAAAALHRGVALAYDGGNGCRALTDASAHALASALLPVRLLVAAWIVATGMALTEGASSAVGRVRWPAWFGATLAVAALAAWEQAFIGTDVLSAFFPLVVLWLLVLVAAAALVVSAVVRRRDPLGPWLWAFVGWLLVTAGALPLALIALTNDGAIRSC